MNFPEDHIQSSDALLEMSQGHWEGCHRSEMYTPEVMKLMDRFQPDFSAPSGESMRQVEFRIIQFLNGTVVGLPEKFRSDFSPPSQNDNQEFLHHAPPPPLPSPNWDLLHRHRPGLTKKKSGKSRLQVVVTTGDHEADDEMSPREPQIQNSHNEINLRSNSTYVSSTIGVFTHSLPIKCIVTGLLGCSPAMSHRICVDDSSVSVLQHSWKTGWQIKRLNDTSHLRLL